MAVPKPNSVEAERELLAACFKGNGTDVGNDDIVSAVLSELSPSHWAHPHYQKIYVALAEAVIDSGSTKVEWGDVRGMIDKDSQARTTLKDIVTNTQLPPISRYWVGKNISTIDDMHKCRQILTIGESVKLKAQAGDAANAYSDLMDAVFALSKDRFSTGAQPWSYFIDEIKDEVTQRRLRGGVVGLKTGMAPFDNVFGGLQKKHLYYVGARPGHKKSVVCFEASYNVADNGYRVLVASPEMSTQQYTMRTACAMVELDFDLYNKGQYSESDAERLHKCLELFRHQNIIFNESGEQSTITIRQDLIKFQPDMLMVDYSQLFSPSRPKNAEYQDLSLFSKELNSIKKDFNIPVLAAVQLSRKVEDRENKRPVQSDIRSTGQFEQDADGIFMLYNERKYAKKDELGIWRMDTSDGQVEIDPTRLEFVCAKNRNGSEEDVVMYSKEGELWLRNERDW